MRKEWGNQVVLYLSPVFLLVRVEKVGNRTDRFVTAVVPCSICAILAVESFLFVMGDLMGGFVVPVHVPFHTWTFLLLILMGMEINHDGIGVEHEG